MAKMTKIEFELTKDIGKHLFVQKQMKGGISYIARRYSKANNQYMKSNDPNKPSKYITYLDVSNLYGQTMSKYLPYGVFKWLNQKEFDGFDVTQLVKIVLMDMYQKLTLSILMNWIVFIMIIHQLQKNLKLVMI